MFLQVRTQTVSPNETFETNWADVPLADVRTKVVGNVSSMSYRLPAELALEMRLCPDTKRLLSTIMQLRDFNFLKVVAPISPCSVRVLKHNTETVVVHSRSRWCYC